MFFFVLQVLPVLRRSPEGPGGFRDFADGATPHWAAQIKHPTQQRDTVVFSIPTSHRLCMWRTRLPVAKYGPHPCPFCFRPCVILIDFSAKPPVSQKSSVHQSRAAAI